MTDWFDELHDKRKRLVSTLEENNTDLRMLLEDKYADPVHFVYELLQNAEDQKAKHVEFLLTPDRLLFKHYGDTFKQRDVDSITNVGNSSKQGQVNKIGCFGIGFKSVFDVTSRPRIYSTLDEEPFAFAIEEKFVPVRLSCPKELLEPNETRFEFPFKQGQEAEIFSKVWKKLRELGPDTLLFLDHIEEIKWRTTTEEGIYLCERADPVSGKVQLVWEAGPRDTSKETQYMQFLRYSKIAPIKRGDSDLKVSIAFRLENDQIVSEPGLSVLNVFFPTSEKTGLKFRLHAPMLLTDSRANIRPDDPTNRQLVRTCAELLAESLPKLRDADMLTATCLNCLPIREEDFPEQTVFRPLYDAVLKALATQKLLPTARESSCKYVDAVHARLTESKPLRAFMSEKQLMELEDSDMPVCWLPENIGNDTTRDLWVYLTKQLHIETLDGEKLARKISERFLQKQPDDWITSFYHFLSTSPYLWDKNRYSPLRSKPIIRLQNDQHVIPFDRQGSPNAFLPTGSNSALDTVKTSVCEDEKARKFLVDLGLTLPDTTDEVIRLILPAYRQSPLPPYSVSEYNLQLTTIATAIENCKPDESDELRSQLLQTPFLRVCNAVNSSTCKWVEPDKLYLRSTELIKWFEGNGEAWFASSTVTKHPGWPCIFKFLNTRRRPSFGTEEDAVVTDTVVFRTASKGKHGFVHLYSSHGWHRRGINGFDPSSQIEGLEFALSHITKDRAYILWKLLSKEAYLVQGCVEEATRQDYIKSDYSIEFSVVGQLCRKHPWLPDRTGNYFKPENIALSDLSDDFDYMSETAIQLAEKLGMKQIVKTQEQLQAEELHLTVDIVEYIKNNPELIAQFVRSKQSPVTSSQFPVDEDVTFSERRAVKVQEEARNNPEVRREQRLRTVRLCSPEYKAEAKPYLQSHYKDDWGTMFCQICELPMPFKLPNGESYFEIVQYVKGLPNESQRHYLALCPLCAAKYLYANGNDAESLQHAAVHADLQTDSLTIPVELAGDHCTIRFRQKHLGDLKNTLIGMLQPAGDSEEE